MRKKDLYLTLDTETATTPEYRDSKDPTTYPLVYDLGGCIHDRKGNIIDDFSFVIKDIFCDYKNMATAYYVNKLPKYIDGLYNGDWKPMTWYQAREYIKAIIKKYNIKKVFAYNARFDNKALNNTMEHLTGGDYKYYFGKNVIWCDTMKAVRQTIASQKKYGDYCKKNGYLTATGKPQVKAEIVYRYLKQDDDFIESHTALDDARIETFILAKCFEKHMKMDFKLFKKKAATLLPVVATPMLPMVV